MTARLVPHPSEAAYYVELVYQRALDSYGLKETEVDYSTHYFDQEPAEWQLTDLLPEGWTLIQQNISPLNKDEFEEELELDSYSVYYDYDEDILTLEPFDEEDDEELDYDCE